MVVSVTVGSLVAETQLAAKHIEQPQAGDVGTTKGAAATPEQVEALRKFREILTKLVSQSTAQPPGSTPLPSPRNPIVMLIRWYQREPGFEEKVAKYASMLPILETSGRSYSEMALIGIIALRARQLEVAETVYAEMRFQTTASAALEPMTKGIIVIVFVLVLLSIIFAAVLYGHRHLE
jgi:hypothetical protein